MTRLWRSSLALFAVLALALSTFGRPDVPKTNASLDLFYSSQWNDAPCYTRDPITATWGLKSEGGGLPPASCAATIDNRSGDYVSTDARSSLYGLIGRNTPARVALTPGLTTGSWADTTDAFTRTSVDSWGVSSSGQAWSTYLGGGAASDFQVASGVGSQMVTAANTLRLAYMPILDVTDFTAAVTMTAPQATGASLEIGTIAFRGFSTGSSDYQQLRVLANTDNSVQLRAVTAGASLALVTVAGLTHAGTGTPLRVRVQVHGPVIAARVWIAASAEPTTWQLLTVNTVDTVPAVSAGWIGIRSARSLGNTNVNPVFKFDDWTTTTQVPLVNGGVSTWDPDRAVKGDAWTGIEINGPANQINADRGVRSALTRTLSAPNAGTGTGVHPPDAWWPMEGQDLAAHTAGTGAVSTTVPALVPSAFTSAFFPTDPVGPITTYTGPEITGTASLVDLAAGSQLIATPPYSSTATSYAVEISMRGKSAGAAPSLGHQALKFVTDNGSTVTGAGASLAVEIGTDGLVYAHVESLGGLTSVSTGVPFYTDRMRDYRIELSQVGANVQMLIYVDGTNVASAVLTTATLGSLRQVIMNYPSSADESVPQYGQLRIWNTASWVAQYYQGANGYLGETAKARFTRVCRESGITSQVIGSDTADMGPQFPATLNDILDEIARTDNGLIYDALSFNGLEFRTGRSRYNQTPGLALTYGFDVPPPLKPSTGDLGLTNSVTASRPNAGTAVAQQTSGPLNINDPFIDPAGIGLVPTTLDVNPDTDADLPSAASWGLHTGTWLGARYENVTVDLTAHPELYQLALSMRPGDVLTIDSLEADQVELQVIGGKYFVENNHLRVTFNCVPGGPYRILQVESSGFMRIGSGTSSLAADFNAGVATSMSVAVTGALWDTTAPPFYIMVGGVVLNVTAISGAASPQTFTITATPVNGVTRLLSATAPANLTRVNVYPPIYIGL